jgi:beta-phosphoglucomutase-like phosphatase (HAD superfamily)
VYQQVMAGKPRMAGARAALEYFGVPDVEARAERYGAAKQEQVIRLIEEGRFMAFPDALRFILVVKGMGIRVAAASSSKNAKLFLSRIRLDLFAAEQRLEYGFVRPRMTLEEVFDADISGRDFPRGKPDPAIFLTAAAELGLDPAGCFVVEDASSGVQAAKASGMAALGVATGTYWRGPVPTWSCPAWTTSPCRRWPWETWRSGGWPPSCASGTPSGRRVSGR